MKSIILTVAAAALLAIPTLRAADEKPADKPAGDKPAGERPNRGPGGPGGPGGRFGGTPEERVKRITEQLGLTPEQAEKIKAIYEKGAEANKALREKGFNNLTDEEKTKMRDSMKAQQDEIAAILTPEQKKKQEEARGQRGGPGGGRRGGGAAPGAPAGAPAAPGK